jgi:hypothetical protein
MIAGMPLDELAEVSSSTSQTLALIEDGAARIGPWRRGRRPRQRDPVGQELDLESEASGISTATREGARCGS